MNTRNKDLSRCRWLGTVALASCLAVVTVAQAQQSAAMPAQVFGYGTLRLMAMSPDAKRIATAGSRGIFVWDADTGDLIRSFEKDFVPGDWPHRDDTSSIAIAPNGETLAAGSWDGTVRVWYVSSGTRLMQIETDVRSVTFSPDGLRIITLGGTSFESAPRVGQATIWNLATAQSELDVPIPFGTRTVTFSPNGDRFAACGYLENQTGAAGVWDAVTGELLFSLNGHAHQVNAVAFSPDGSRIATGAGGYNQATSQNEGSVRIWNAVDGELIAPIPLSDRVWSLAFSPDSKTLIAGAGEYYDPGRSDGGKVFVWDADAGTGMRTLTLHQSAIHSIAFVQDGTGFWTASDDRTVRQTGLDGQALKVFDQHVANYSFGNVAFSPDGLKACTGHFTSPAVWECATGRILFRLDVPRASQAAFSPDGSKLLIAGWEDFIVSLWNAQDGTPIATFEGHTNWVSAIAWSPDGTRIMTGGADGTARVWDVETGQTVWNLSHPDRVMSVSFSRDGRQALTGDGDWHRGFSRSETRLWDLESGQLLRTFEGGLKCEFSRDGTKIRTADGRGNLNVFDASNGTLVQNLDIGWREFAFSTDERFFVTFTPSAGYGDVGYEAKLYEADTGRLLRTLDAAAEWMRAAFWPGGDHVLTGTGSWDGVARLWSIEALTNAQNVYIPDPGLLAAIRSALNKPTGDITVSDMETLTALDASWAEGSVAPRIQSIAGLAASQNLTSLDLSGNQLTSLTVPNVLSRLTRLDVTGNPLVYLGVPESLRDRLEILGFPVDLVVYIPELRIGPAIVLSDGRLQLQLNGASGQGVRVQRSANLVDWEDWRTMTLDGTGCEVIDETTASSHRFYRAVEDNSVATK